MESLRRRHSCEASETNTQTFVEEGLATRGSFADCLGRGRNGLLRRDKRRKLLGKSLYCRGALQRQDRRGRRWRELELHSTFSEESTRRHSTAPSLAPLLLTATAGAIEVSPLSPAVIGETRQVLEDVRGSVAAQPKSDAALFLDTVSRVENQALCVKQQTRLCVADLHARERDARGGRRLAKKTFTLGETSAAGFRASLASPFAHRTKTPSPRRRRGLFRGLRRRGGKKRRTKRSPTHRQERLSRRPLCHTRTEDSSQLETAPPLAKSFLLSVSLSVRLSIFQLSLDEGERKFAVVHDSPGGPSTIPEFSQRVLSFAFPHFAKGVRAQVDLTSRELRLCLSVFFKGVSPTDALRRNGRRVVGTLPPFGFSPDRCLGLCVLEVSFGRGL